MSLLDIQNQEIYYKIVYYGPGLSGKTQNLVHLYENTSPEAKGKLQSFAANEKQTIRFDFLPLSFGKIHEVQTWLHLYALPGQMFYDDNLSSLFKGTDGIIFVVDSRPERFEANLEAFEMLSEFLIDKQNGSYIPLVVQYNKRDLENAISLEKLRTFCNPEKAPEFEAASLTGIGVFETIKEMAKQVFGKRRRS